MEKFNFKIFRIFFATVTWHWHLKVWTYLRKGRKTLYQQESLSSLWQLEYVFVCCFVWVCVCLHIWEEEERERERKREREKERERKKERKRESTCLYTYAWKLVCVSEWRCVKCLYPMIFKCLFLLQKNGFNLKPFELKNLENCPHKLITQIHNQICVYSLKPFLECKRVTSKLYFKAEKLLFKSAIFHS